MAKDTQWIINIGDLLVSDTGSNVEVRHMVKVEGQDEFKFPIPFSIAVNLQKADQGMVLGKFKVSGKIASSCFRCLADVEKELDFEFDAVFCEVNDENEDCDSEIKNSCINFKELFLQEIGLQKPLKFLCKKDCKGLCIDCGENLNLKKCKCNKINSKFKPQSAK